VLGETMTDDQIKIRMKAIDTLVTLGADTYEDGITDLDFHKKLLYLSAQFAEELTPYQDKVHELYGHIKNSHNIPKVMNELLAVKREINNHVD